MVSLGGCFPLHAICEFIHLIRALSFYTFEFIHHLNRADILAVQR